LLNFLHVLYRKFLLGRTLVSKFSKSLFAQATTFSFERNRVCGTDLLDSLPVLSRSARWLVLACILASPLATPTAAHAADDKTTPGSNCVPASGNVSGGPRFSLSDTVFLNASATGTLRADCPIIKERVGRGILSSSIFVIDNNPTKDVRCELVSNQVVQNAPITSRRGITRSTSDASPAVRRLDLGGLPAVSGIGSDWYVGCTLPPSTGIVSYYVDEQP
jgi:hypothetical protein